MTPAPAALLPAAPLPALRARRPARRRAGPALLAGAALALAALAAANHRRAARAEGANPPLGEVMDLGGVRLHVVERGPEAPQGDPVVILHGNGSMVEDPVASGLVDALAARRRVLAFDRPGFGHSSRPRGRPWTAGRQADLLALALDRLGVGRATVLGHSWGCLVALALARRHPARVGALVLESGYHFATPRADVLVMAPPALPVLGDIWRHTGAPLLAGLLWPRLVGKLFAPTPVAPSWARVPRDMALRPSQLRAAAEESALMIPEAWAASRHHGALLVPLAIVAGAGDRMADPEAQSRRLHESVPGSHLEIVPGQGHMLHHTALDAVLRAVERVAPL